MADGPSVAESEDAKTLDTVQVFGTLDNALSVGSKTGQSLRETPKSVTVVTRERLDVQNLTTLTEALVQTTGVTVGSWSPLDSFYYSRGFRVQTMQFDGGAPAYTGGFGFFYTPDMAVYDHIEMLRGVDGMYTGAGEPGGVINLVRKRPQNTKAIQLDVSAGTWDNYRAQLDVTGPLGLEGRLRGRAVAAYVDRGYFWDRETTKKKIFYGVLEFDATDSTLLSLGANYEKRDDGNYPGWSGVPRYNDGSDIQLPRSTAFNPDWAHWNFENKEVFAKVEQKYGDTGVVKLNLTRIQQDSDAKYLLTSAPNGVDPTTLGGTVSYASINEYSSVQSLADLSASGKFDLFGRTHSYTVGTDYSVLDGGGQKTSAMTGYVYPGPAIDLYNFDPSLYPEGNTYATYLYPVNKQSQKGYYATLGLQLADPLRLTLGGRYGEYNYKRVQYRVSNGLTSYLNYSDSKFIPSAALSYTLSKDWTAYLSYGENFKVQANMLQGPLPGTPLDPVTGDNLELGVKGELFGHLNAAAAIYRVRRSGQGVQDPLYALTSNVNDGSSCCYIKQADVTAEGIDLELSGVMAPGWQLFAGYTHVKTKYEGGSSGLWSTGAALLGVTPRNTLKVWSTWRLPGDLYRWTLNGGVIVQSEGYMSGSIGTTPVTYTQPGYALWNASVQFEVNDVWTIGLYGDNLTDKTYYQAIGSIYNENVYGAPRSYTLTLRGRW